jgi:hypothetical protein
MVSLSRGARGTTKTRLVHHLVLEAFVGPRPDGQVGCHFDDDPRNNRVENLRWDTSSANALDRVRNAALLENGRSE